MATYPGGKNGSGVSERIISEIPPHGVYCEPFLGSGAVLRRMRPASLSIGIDLDAAAIAQFRESARADLDGVDVVTLRPPEWMDLGLAERVVLRARSGRPQLVLLVADALPFLSTWPWAATDVIYADPSYLPETRSKRRVYKHELTRNQHKQLLEIFVALPCRVLLSGYPSWLYERQLKAWRFEQYDVMTRGGVRRECLWCNFPEPEVLHDDRWIGSDFRDRERIRRRQRNWRRALLAMPPVERNAMLAVLNADPIAECRDARSTTAESGEGRPADAATSRGDRRKVRGGPPRRIRRGAGRAGRSGAEGEPNG